MKKKDGKEKEKKKVLAMTKSLSRILAVPRRKRKKEK